MVTNAARAACSFAASPVLTARHAAQAWSSWASLMGETTSCGGAGLVGSFLTSVRVTEPPAVAPVAVAPASTLGVPASFLPTAEPLFLRGVVTSAGSSSGSAPVSPGSVVSSTESSFVGGGFCFFFHSATSGSTSSIWAEATVLSKTNAPAQTEANALIFKPERLVRPGRAREHSSVGVGPPPRSLTCASKNSPQNSPTLRVMTSVEHGAVQRSVEEMSVAAAVAVH